MGCASSSPLVENGKTFVDGAKSSVTETLAKGGRMLEDVGESAKEGIDTVKETMHTAVTSAENGVENVMGKLGETFNFASNKATNLQGDLEAKKDELVTNASDTAAEAVSEAETVLASEAESAKEAFTSKTSPVFETVHSIGEDAEHIVTDIHENSVEFIEDLEDRVDNVLGDDVDTVENDTEEIIKTESPVKELVKEDSPKLHVDMNIILNRHAAKYIYCIPDGLKELMTDISREVLRSQPENMYLFIADYLEALLITRENARIAARMVQSITEIAEATVEFLEQSGVERPQADRIVAIIHEAFKKRIKDDVVTIQSEQQSEEIEEANLITDILEQAEIPSELAEEAAKIIQSAYRKFKTRKQMERQLLSGMIDWRIAARSAIRLYRQTGATNEEANRAATLIKAAYKGYYTRRVMKKLVDEQKFLHPMLEEEEIAIEPEEQPEFDLAYKELFHEDSKTVKIDYDTVIPHVDFGDVTTAEASQQTHVTKKESTPSAIISYALDKVLDNALKKADLNYSDAPFGSFPPESAEPKDEMWQVTDYLDQDAGSA